MQIGQRRVPLIICMMKFNEMVQQIKLFQSKSIENNNRTVMLNGKLFEICNIKISLPTKSQQFENKINAEDVKSEPLMNNPLKLENIVFRTIVKLP